MSKKLVITAAAVAFCMNVIGCGGGNAVQMDTNSTIRYESKRDGEPKIMGGPGGGLQKGKGTGGPAPPP